MRIALALVLLAAQDDLEKKLETTISLSARGTLDDLLDVVRKETDLNIVVDRRAADRVDLKRPVELRLQKVTARLALRWAATLYGLEISTAGGAVVVTHPDHPGTALETRLFDVGGLTSRPSDFAAPSDAAKEPVVVLEGTGLSGTADDSTISLIRQAVAPSSWDGDSVSIQAVQPGRISVRHYPAVLDRIAAFVAALRRMAPAMITVEADLFDLDADASKKLDALFGGAIDAATVEALQPLRRAKGAETLRLTCCEGQLSHVTVASQSTLRLFDGQAVSRVALPSSSILEVRPVLAGGSVKLDVALRTSRIVDPVATAKIGGEEADLPESTLGSLRTTLVVPAKGAALLRLPRASRDAKHPRALLLRVTPSGGAVEAPPDRDADRLPDKPLDIDLRDATVAEFGAQLRDKCAVNVVVHPDLLDQKLTLRLKAVKPRGLLDLVAGMNGWVASWRDDAIYLAPSARAEQRTWTAAVRDLALGASDDAWEGAAPFDPFGVSDLVRASVRPRTWGDNGVFCECTASGILVLRHAPDAILEAAAFLNQLRKTPRVALRADLVTVKSADELLAASEAGWLVDADAAAKILDAAVAPPERLQLDGVSGRRAGLSWSRRRTLLKDGTVSMVEARSVVDLLAAGGRLTLNIESQELSGTESTSLTARAVLRTTVSIPAARAGVFKLGAADGAVRLLVVRLAER
jgi:hypothetical protein